jgi:hypothetical protein
VEAVRQKSAVVTSADLAAASGSLKLPSHENILGDKELYCLLEN